MTQRHPRETPLEQLARLICRLDRREKALLLRMVPELQTIEPDEIEAFAEEVHAGEVQRLKDCNDT
jgi:hypothetical protein